MEKKNGWDKQCAEPWDEIFEIGWEVDFTYRGRAYRLDLCADPALLIDVTEKGNFKVVATFKTESDFYNAVVFGKPILEVFDEAVVTMIW